MSEKKAKQKRREKKTKTQRDLFNEIKKKNIQVNLLKAAQILDKMITQSLCETVFKTERTDERQRIWTLYAMVEFWNAIILNAPQSLRQALEEAEEGSPQWPKVKSSPEAFFQRSQNLSWRFFASTHEAFCRRIGEIADLGFAQEFLSLRERFSEVYILDGSTLDAILHRLKILRQEPTAVLPGSILAAYDLFRGYAPLVAFFENANESEMKRLETILDQIPKRSLLIADRIYATAKLFGILGENKLWGLFRRHASLSLRKQKLLSRKRVPGGVLEDWLVEAGSGWNSTPQPLLRWVIFRSRNQGHYELLTNVLDPKELSAEEAMELYGARWSVERLFYDLKEVLDLHHFYAGNVNAVAMQVYAAAMVHTAMRMAQARISRQMGIRGEQLSTEKFFPRMAAAIVRYQGMRAGAQWIKDLNPGVHLKEPNWNQAKVGSVRLHQILVEPRKESPPRKDLRKPTNKKGYTSLHKIMLYSQN